MYKKYLYINNGKEKLKKQNYKIILYIALKFKSYIYIFLMIISKLYMYNIGRRK